MQVPRVGHSSFALNGRVYAVGGMDGKARGARDVFFFLLRQVVVSSYEVYDVAQRAWLAPQELHTT